MNQNRTRVMRTAAVMIGVATVIYLLRWQIFGFPDEMLRYLMDDVAFLLIQALIVWLVLDRVLRQWERESMLNKLNMVIGAFYGEVGTTLMGAIASFDAEFCDVRPRLLVKPGWTDAQYADAKSLVAEYDFSIELHCGDLPGLKALLLQHRGFFLSLLENQNLLEHETFTELLWAVFHLTEELAVRPDVTCLQPTDALHITLDTQRVYRLLIAEWLDYMRHLQTQYPHLFSFAVRTNPLDPEAQVTVTQ